MPGGAVSVAAHCQGSSWYLVARIAGKQAASLSSPTHPNLTLRLARVLHGCCGCRRGFASAGSAAASEASSAASSEEPGEGSDDGAHINEFPSGDRGGRSGWIGSGWGADSVVISRLLGSSTHATPRQEVCPGMPRRGDRRRASDPLGISDFLGEPWEPRFWREIEGPGSDPGPGVRYELSRLGGAGEHPTLEGHPSGKDLVAFQCPLLHSQTGRLPEGRVGRPWPRARPSSYPA